MKNLDCNQIKIFIHLEIIGEEKFYIYIYIYIYPKILKKLCNLVKPFGTTMTSKPNFYHIIYDVLICYNKFIIMDYNNLDFVS